MDAEYRAKKRVEQSQTLLERMAREPEKVLEALEPAECREVTEELRMLSDRASTVRSGSELLELAIAVIRFVKQRPALEAQFPVTVRRRGGTCDIDNLFSEGEVLEYADQIDNSVEKLGQAIDRKLERLPERSGDHDRR